MDKNKLCSILYYITAISFYISAILNFTNSNTSMGVIYLSLGSTFICLGSLHTSKQVQKNDNIKRMYLDMTDNNCTAVFIKDTEIIHAGTTVNSMSAEDKNEKYDLIADRYDIHFIYDDNVPNIDIYTIPYIDICATDSDGGYIGTIGESCDINSKAKICYIDNDRKCYIIASSLKRLLNNLDSWKEKKVLCNNINIFSSKQEAMKIFEFVDLKSLK